MPPFDDDLLTSILSGVDPRREMCALSRLREMELVAQEVGDGASLSHEQLERISSCWRLNSALVSAWVAGLTPVPA